MSVSPPTSLSPLKAIAFVVVFFVSSSSSSSSVSSISSASTSMLSSTPSEAVISELTLQYESQLASLEKRLASMERLLNENVKNNIKIRHVDDNNDNNDNQNGNDDGKIYGNNKHTVRMSHNVEVPQEEPKESVKEDEVEWLDDFLRRKGIKPPFDHRLLPQQRQQKQQQQQQQPQQHNTLGKMDQKQDYEKNNLRRSRERHRKRRVKRSGYFYASNCPPGSAHSTRMCSRQRDGGNFAAASGANGYDPWRRGGYAAAGGNDGNFAATDHRQTKCVGVGSFNGDWGSAASSSADVYPGAGYVVSNPDISTGLCPRGCRKVWIPAGVVLPPGGVVVGEPLDKCTGEGCQCPEGMTGIQPFCRPKQPEIQQVPDRCVGDVCNCPPGTTGVQPFCQPEVPPQPQDKCIGDSCKCPPGMTGIQPFCRPNEKAPLEPDRCAGDSCKCPPGTTGVQPFCRSVEEVPGSPQDSCVGASCKCPPGTTGVQPFCKPIEQQPKVKCTGDGCECPPGTTGFQPSCKPISTGPFSYRGPNGGDHCAVIQCPPGAAGPPGPPGPPGRPGTGGGFQSDDFVDRMMGDQPREDNLPDKKISRSAAGFTAYLTHDMTATLAKPIVFQETLTNTGRHYDVGTGKFVAPVDGLFHFEFHVMFRRDASASPVVDLMRNGKSLASAWRTQGNGRRHRFTRGAHHRHRNNNDVKGDDDQEFLHNSLLLQLQEGDEVWLQLYWNSIVGGRFLKPTTFSGFLVAAL